MTATLDLDAYLARIRWGGAVRHDLATFSALLRAHMSALPFENLDVLLGRPIRLDLEGLQDKLVRASRGWPTAPRSGACWSSASASTWWKLSNCACHRSLVGCERMLP